MVLIGRDLTEQGLPRRLGLYEIGEPRKIGSRYQVPVQTVRQVGLRVPPVVFEVNASSARRAHAQAIGYYHQVAEEMDLEVLITDPNE